MTYRFDDGQVGYPPIEGVLPVQATIPPNPFWSRSFIAVAEDPVWGCGEFVFGQVGVGGVRIYGGCVALPVWDATNKIYTYNFTEWPATTLLGRPGYIWQGNRAAVVGEYGWFQMTGRSPVNGTATVGADTAAGHNATGQLTANGASLQLLNARVITPATQTVVAAVAGFGASGDTTIGLTNVSGFIIGGYLSGTGVGAAAIVSGIDPIGKTITATVVNSAQVTGNVTCTYNNATIFYNVLEMNRVMLQGPIT
jgi:hypothetical protein